METLITWMHYASTYFLSLGLLLFFRSLSSPVCLSRSQREARVYIPVYSSLCFAALFEAVSCYFAGREDDFRTAITIAVVPFMSVICLFVKNIFIKREGDGNP